MEQLQSVIFQDAVKSSWNYSSAGSPKGHECLIRQVRHPQILTSLVIKKQATGGTSALESQGCYLGCG